MFARPNPRLPSRMPPPRESLVDVLGLLARHRRRLLQVVGAAFVLSVVVALLSPVYYEAHTTFLAASSDLNNPSKIFATDVVNLYGSGDDVERVLSAAESEGTVGFLVDSFDLYAAYEIDTADRDAATRVREELADHYTVRRTKYDEIEIAVEDQDPRKAAAMANAARDRSAAVIQATSQLGQRDMAALFQRTIEAERAELDAISDSLASVNDRYGILEPGIQGQQLAGLRNSVERGIRTDSVVASELRRSSLGSRLRDSVLVIEARLQASRASRDQIEDQIDKYTTGSGRAKSLLTRYRILSDQLSYDLQRQQRVEAIMESPGPVIYISEAARVPDRKSRPRRTFIVLGVTLAAAVFAVLGLLVYDTYKRVDWRRYGS